MALRNDGTVVAWGASAKRQTSVPAGLGDVTAIAAGLEFTLALKVDGSVISWGSSIGIPPAAAQSEVSAIPAGGGYSLALEVDG